MTRAVYDEYVRRYGAAWTDPFLAQNGIEVEGMQPVNYQQPDEEMYDENGELYPLANQGGALPSAPALPSVATQSAPSSGNVPGLPSLQDIYGMQAQLGKDLSTFWSDVRKDRKAQYDLATAELEKRRFGPSRAEQLFQLAAAIGTPTIDRSFGSIMANVIPAFASIEKAKRTAEEERSAAAQALRNKYLGEDQQLGFNILEQRQKNLSAVTPLAVAQARAGIKKAPYAKVYTDNMGITRHKVTGSKLIEPPLNEILVLQKYLADPNNTDDNKQIARQRFDTSYGYGASDVYGEQ